MVKWDSSWNKNWGKLDQNEKECSFHLDIFDSLTWQRDIQQIQDWRNWISNGKWREGNFWNKLRILTSAMVDISAHSSPFQLILFCDEITLLIWSILSFKKLTKSSTVEGVIITMGQFRPGWLLFMIKIESIIEGLFTEKPVFKFNIFAGIFD